MVEVIMDNQNSGTNKNCVQWYILFLDKPF